MLRASVLLAISALAVPIQSGARSRFGLEPGREWIYTGSARWTTDGNRVDSGSVHWVMQCLAVRSRNGLRAALVRGWVHELAWYAPGDRPSFSALIEYRERLYVIDAADSAIAVESIAHALRTDPRALSSGSAVIDSGLAAGRLYGGEPDRGDRPDAFYAWHVEGPVSVADQAPWRRLALVPSGWRIAYRTRPDHEVLDFVPGIGITRYVYSHHGTVADTDVRLVAVRDAPR